MSTSVHKPQYKTQLQQSKNFNHTIKHLLPKSNVIPTILLDIIVLHDRYQTKRQERIFQEQKLTHYSLIILPTNVLTACYVNCGKQLVNKHTLPKSESLARVCKFVSISEKRKRENKSLFSFRKNKG